jgi:hypothetical protein
VSVNGYDNSCQFRLTFRPLNGGMSAPSSYAPPVDWDVHAAREKERYADALERLPDDPDRRQKQLVRAAMSAGAAGLARLMRGRGAEAAGWFVRSAERYRESFAGAPPASWGRLIGALKSRLLAGDWVGAEADARWALEQAPGGGAIGDYAAALALLVLGEDAEAASVAGALQGADDFPADVANALAALAAGNAAGYSAACESVLESFENRDAHLEDLPVADTVIVLEALAGRRQIAAKPVSGLLPG